MSFVKLDAPLNTSWGKVVLSYNLETAVQGDEMIQDLESERKTEPEHITKLVRAQAQFHPYGSRDCIISSPSTAVSRFNQEEIDFPLYIPSGEVFNHDPALVIRLKHLALTVLTPLMTVIRTVYWLALSIFSTFAVAYHYLDDDNVSSESLLQIKETAYDVVRAWKYGILMTGCALAGIAAPFWGRLHYGHFERTLNRHSDGPHRDKYYTAICFQRLSILRKEEPLYDEKAVQKIKKYLNRIDEKQEIVTRLQNIFSSNNFASIRAYPVKVLK